MLGSKCMDMVNYQNKLFWVYRKVNKRLIKENHILDVRDLWHCDTVLKTKNQEEDMLIFLVEIPDATVIDESYPQPSPAPIPVP